MKKNKKKNPIEQFKGVKAKKNIKGTAIKSIVDVVVGATLGAGLGAASGKFALPLGALLIAGSHYMGEETGVLRLAGAGSFAYGIAKAKINKGTSTDRMLQEPSTVKTRVVDFKDDLFEALYLSEVVDKMKNPSKSNDTNSEVGAVHVQDNTEVIMQQLRQSGTDFHQSLSNTTDEMSAFPAGYLNPSDDDFELLEEDLTHI